MFPLRVDQILEGLLCSGWQTESDKIYFPLYRASDRKGKLDNLGIIFLIFPLKTYIVTPH